MAINFFISYNKADKTWAEWVAWQLEANGYTTVIQAWDFKAGNNLCHFLKIRFVVWNRSLKSSTGAWIAPLSHLHIRIQLDEFRVGVMGKFEMA